MWRKFWLEFLIFVGENFIFVSFSPILVSFPIFLHPNNSLLERRLNIFNWNILHSITYFEVINSIVTTLWHVITIGNKRLWQLQWTQNIMFIKVVVTVFKLAPSSLMYAITLSSNSYQISISFNYTTMVTLVFSWTLKISTMIWHTSHFLLM